MDSLTVSNPNIVVTLLVEEYTRISEEEFLDRLEDTLKKTEQFIKSDDSEFFKSLSKDQARVYAYYCQPFHYALQELRIVPRNKEAMHALARTVAWWRTIKAFRAIHGR